MKFLLSFFIILFTGFVNLSGVAACQADTNTADFQSSFEDFILKSQDQHHIDFNWPGTAPEITVAEFEIEESNTFSKEKHIASIPFFGLPATVIKHFYTYKYNYLDSETITPVRASVKSYLLFQVFRL
ncbi:hypothetical protein [Leeuwenhoekiella sp. W20_SRS_FM14]|uniref:hypothetical protein n=1 Tax=Leeuwenhoekiella sp. W20_SRS_FM14 TaxID=3240270 RepID=UPI003F972B28